MSNRSTPATRARLPGLEGLRRFAERFGRDERGVTAIEFSIISVPFFALLAALFETALVSFATESVSAAVDQASRQVLTGQAQANAQISNSTQFRDAMFCSPGAPLANLLPSFVDCSKMIVDIRPAASFSSADVSNDIYDNVTGEYCTGGPGDIVIVRAVYPMPVYFPILQGSGSAITVNVAGQTQVGGLWTHMIMGVSAFRNEPFPTSANPVPGC
jgi:Flp pilus assembly protein TadG